MIETIVAVWRLRPRALRSLPNAERRAIVIALTTLACTACSGPHAMQPLADSDVTCVRSVENTGGSFLQAVAHCQKNPFDTSYPAMLDLGGAPDLQKQAFQSGYYNRDLPASNSAEAARFQALQSGLTAAMAVRQKSQGKTVKQLSNTECMTDLLAVPHEAFALGPSWDVGGQTNPYLTPQENECVARQRAAAALPHAAPAAATPSAEKQQEEAASSHILATPLANESANAVHPPKPPHTVSAPTGETSKVLIL